MTATITIPTLPQRVSSVDGLIGFYLRPAKVSVRYTRQRLSAQYAIKNTESDHRGQVEDTGKENSQVTDGR